VVTAIGGELSHFVSYNLLLLEEIIESKLSISCVSDESLERIGDMKY
jgi:hypothetical protein